jgi:6-phosphogluconolactonase (cycloisomerase 2 family)
MKPKFMLALLAALTMGATAFAQGTDAPRAASDRSGSDRGEPQHQTSARGSVYTQTNAVEGNEILVFSRGPGGKLKLAQRVPTHGLGTGMGLGSQGALVLARDGRFLYAVNAGSDSISVFARGRRGLSLIDRVASGGDQPISLTVKRNLLYVLNAGEGNSIAGFRIAPNGHLRSLTGSKQPLSAQGVQPAQVLFNNTGDFLLVTEKATNHLDLYSVSATGLANGPSVKDSSGVTPFGFEFDARDRPIVSEAFADAPGQSAVSSYDFDAADAPLEAISASVPSGQTSACWVTITRNGHYAYVANTGSGTISAYAIARNGELALVGNGVTANTGADSKPQDLALSRGSHFLFVLTPGSGAVHSFEAAADGSLQRLDQALGVPPSAQGLVAD